MVADSLSLPDGVLLRAAAPPRHEPSAWHGDPLRRSLWLRLVFALFVFAAVVMSFAYAMGSAIAPFTASYQHGSGAVTGLVPVDSRGDRQCRLAIAFADGGEQLRGTSHDPLACASAPAVGTVLQISFDPRNPADVHVVDSRVGLDSWVWFEGFIAFALICASGIYLGLAATAYRRARALASHHPEWREVTAVVKGRRTNRGRTSLLLQAEDTAGDSRLFFLIYRGKAPWASTPHRTDRLAFAAVTDARGYSVLSIEGSPRLWLVRFYVPNDVELRAMGA
jgi:hypothetical protein